MANQDTFSENRRSGANMGGRQQKGGQSVDQGKIGSESMTDRFSLGNMNLGSLGLGSFGWKSALSTLGVLGAIGALSAFGVKKYRGSEMSSEFTGNREERRASGKSSKKARH